MSAAEDEKDRDGDAALTAAAERYWRLWRRNWRPPFSEGDAPGGADGDRPSASAP